MSVSDIDYFTNGKQYTMIVNTLMLSIYQSKTCSTSSIVHDIGALIYCEIKEVTKD